MRCLFFSGGFRALWLFVVTALISLSATSARAATQAELMDALRSGGHVLLLRHAQTDPGVGDPPNFKLNECSTQRNLSAAGRAQAKRMAEAFKAQNVRFAKVLTSQWCRCRDTALAFTEKPEEFSAINSFFDDRGTEPQQTKAVRARLKMIAASESWLLVTHQVNITALTGVVPSMGEGVVVKVLGGQWRVIGNLAL